MSEPRRVEPAKPAVTCCCPPELTADIHRHADGSHWCNRCLGYVGYVGPNGVDWPGEGTHPENCECLPCPGACVN